METQTTAQENAPTEIKPKYPNSLAILRRATGHALSVGQANPNTPHGVDMLSFRSELELAIDDDIKNILFPATHDKSS